MLFRIVRFADRVWQSRDESNTAPISLSSFAKYMLSSDIHISPIGHPRWAIHAHFIEAIVVLQESNTCYVGLGAVTKLYMLCKDPGKRLMR